MSVLRPILFIAFSFVALCPAQSGAVPATSEPSIPAVKIQVERLQDLHTPRGGHSTFYVNNEVVVVGGHTSGFLPTATAEYLADGEWHQIETVYNHDNGFSLPMQDRVLLGAGHEKSLGIGQVYHVEWYDHVHHTFSGFSCMDSPRTYAQAARLRDGDVIISGNWYHDDDMELFDGSKTFTHARNVTIGRGCPYIFPTSDNDALILSSFSTRGEIYGFPTTVDRLRRDSFAPPLLATWRPLAALIEHRAADCCISDTCRGEYAYLMPVQNKQGLLSPGHRRPHISACLPFGTR